jgi:hypothetical protein
MDGAAASALSAENAALRRSLTAQNERVEALRSDLERSREGEATAAGDLRAAKVAAASTAAAAAAAAAAASDGDGSRPSAHISALALADADADGDCNNLREVLEATRDLSRRQETQHEAQVTELREAGRCRLTQG